MHPRLHSIVKDPSQTPTEMAEQISEQGDVSRLVCKTLRPEQQAVIRLRYGFGTFQNQP